MAMDSREMSPGTGSKIAVTKDTVPVDTGATPQTKRHVRRSVKVTTKKMHRRTRKHSHKG